MDLNKYILYKIPPVHVLVCICGLKKIQNCKSITNLSPSVYVLDTCIYISLYILYMYNDKTMYLSIKKTPDILIPSKSQEVVTHTQI